MSLWALTLCVTVTLGKSVAKSRYRKGVGKGFLEEVTRELCWEEEWKGEGREPGGASRKQKHRKASTEAVQECRGRKGETRLRRHQLLS